MSYTPTSAETTRVRLLTGENVEGSAYTDTVITGLLVDRNGDVYAAAYDLWQFKIADAANAYDFNADGGDYKRSQMYDRFMAEAERCRRMSPTLGRMIIDPTVKRIEDDDAVPFC